ncbi:MAG: hypothetical protein H6735_19135 [Alphaproteobacteria bacterium]|nr:hypothetical protein [Alphaproteobacteria bacterium]
MHPLLADISASPFDAQSPYWVATSVVALASLAVAAVFFARRRRLTEQGEKPPPDEK